MRTIPVLTLSLAIVAVVPSCFEKRVSLPTTGARNVLPPPGATTVETLSQNWTEAVAAKFYNTPQGSQMVPFDYFLHLEHADSEELFRTTANFQRLGYIARQPDADNPHGLAVGFVKDGAYLGMTCAACHTSVITVGQKAVLIDGGGTLADAQGMISGLSAAMKATLADATKFERFLLRSGVGKDATELRAGLQKASDKLGAYVARNFPKDGQPATGHARLDAFDAIFNQVAVVFAANPNAETRANAPVSYPFLWDTPQHDKVQWNGSAENTVLPVEVLGTKKIGALGRNVGEVLGVFADVDTKDDPKLRGYPSSVNVTNLIELEEIVAMLWSPQWPEAVLGKLDTDKMKPGKELYDKHCLSCHAILGGAERMNPKRKIIADMLHDVGTDQTMASNAATRETSSGVFTGRKTLPSMPPLKPVEAVGTLLGHTGQRVLEYVALERLVGGDKVKLLKPLVDLGLDELKILENRSAPSALPEKLSPSDQAIQALEKVLGSSLNYQVHTAMEGTAGSDVQMKVSLEEFRDLSAVDVGPKLQATLADGTQMVAGTPEKLATMTSALKTDGKELVSRLLKREVKPAEVKLTYKARPLNGIWATAPYLHNGSVPNLDELLKPAADRTAKFSTGSTEFDPKVVGFDMTKGPSELDTKAQRGNSNAGHDDYGRAPFSDTERAALLEYLKSL